MRLTFSPFSAHSATFCSPAGVPWKDPEQPMNLELKEEELSSSSRPVDDPRPIEAAWSRGQSRERPGDELS